MTYSQHPLSAAFPEMTPDEFLALKDSIQTIGVQNAVVIYEGMVIDGWHRYSAARELAMACPTMEMDPEIDPKDFVLAQNKNRRHITAGQIALAIASVNQWSPAGRPNNGALSAPFRKTVADMAHDGGVSLRTMKQATSVKANATGLVQDAVRRGDIGLPKAAAIAKMPVSEQAQAISKPLPKSEPDPQAPEDDGPDAEELAANALAAEEDAKHLAKLLDADDKLAFSVAEVKRLNALNAHLQLRVNGLMNEKNEAVKQAKSLERQLQRLRKDGAQ